MRLASSISGIRRRFKTPARGTIQTALKVTAGAGAAIWVALQLKRELYGPGGTKLSRYDRSVDKIWDKRDRN